VMLGEARPHKPRSPCLLFVTIRSRARITAEESDTPPKTDRRQCIPESRPLDRAKCLDRFALAKNLRDSSIRA
jgi:hypothetical protein